VSVPWHRCHRAERHALDTAAFDHFGAEAGRIADQDFVEFGAPHLVGKGHGLVPGIGKLVSLALRLMPGRDKLGAPLFHADGLDGIGHTELFQQRQIGGQERLADMKTRVMLFLEHHHLVAALRQQGAGGGAGGTAAYDQHITFGQRGAGRDGRTELLGHDGS
jgi:hypothetical protein